MFQNDDGPTYICALGRLTGSGQSSGTRRQRPLKTLLPRIVHSNRKHLLLPGLWESAGRDFQMTSFPVSWIGTHILTYILTYSRGQTPPLCPCCSTPHIPAVWKRGEFWFPLLATQKFGPASSLEHPCNGVCTSPN